MFKWCGRLMMLICGLLVLTTLVGCHKREHRTMRVHEERHEGPVEEQSPGEMIVE